MSAAGTTAGLTSGIITRAHYVRPGFSPVTNPAATPSPFAAYDATGYSSVVQRVPQRRQFCPLFREHPRRFSLSGIGKFALPAIMGALGLAGVAMGDHSLAWGALPLIGLVYRKPIFTVMQAWGVHGEQADHSNDLLAERFVPNLTFTDALVSQETSGREWATSHTIIPDHNARVMQKAIAYLRNELRVSPTFMRATTEALLSVYDRIPPKYLPGGRWGSNFVNLLIPRLVETEVLEVTIGENGGFDSFVLTNYLKGNRVADKGAEFKTRAIIHTVQYDGLDVPLDFQTVGTLNVIQKDAFLGWFNRAEFVQARERLAIIARQSKLDKVTMRLLKSSDVRVVPRRLLVWNDMPEQHIGNDASQANVYIHSDSVAEHQASVFMMHDKWYVQNAASKRRTYYWENGRWCKVPKGTVVRIEPGDIIRVGTTLFEVARAALDMEDDSNFHRVFSDALVVSKDTAEDRAKLLASISDNLTSQIGERIVGDQAFRAEVNSLRQKVIEDVQHGRTSFDPRFGVLAPENFAVPESFRRTFDSLYKHGLMNLLYLADAKVGEPYETIVDRTLMAIYDNLIGYQADQDGGDNIWGDSDEEKFSNHLIDHAKRSKAQSWEREGFLFGRNKVGKFSRPPEGRIYLPVDIEHVNHLWDRLASLTSGEYKSVPLTWKVDTDPERYRTADPALLYSKPEHSEAAYNLVLQIYRSHSKWFRNISPLFSAKLKTPDGQDMGGISFAQSHNASGHSFNREIGIVLTLPARGIRLRLALGDLTSYPEVVRTTAYALWMNGISLEHPAFRGPEGLNAFHHIALHSDQWTG